MLNPEKRVLYYILLKFKTAKFELNVKFICTYINWVYNTIHKIVDLYAIKNKT